MCPRLDWMNMRSFFEAISVSCVIPAQSPADDERTVFENLSFAVERGEIVDLVGPSGSGKSSLLTACARLNPHAHGAFALEGKGSGEFTPQQWRRDVAYLPQKPILTGKNVAEAIRLPWTLAIRGKGGKGEHLLPDVQAAANMYMAQASEAKAAIKELDNQVYMARYIRNYLTNKSNSSQLLPANSGIDNPGIATQISEYNSKLLERNSLVSHSSEKNPLVVEMDASLSAMRSALLTSIDNLLVTLNAQIKSQRGYSGQATSQIASNPQQAKYLLSVERQQKVKESLYLYLLQKREENELSQAFTAYNTRIITMPGGSMIPTAPIKKNILLVAFALGLLVPIVIIFIRENMNTVVRGRKDLENMTAPFVGEIPLAFQKSKWYSRKAKTKEEICAIVVKEKSRNVINEAFRVVRTNLEFVVGKEREFSVCQIIFRYRIIFCKIGIHN